MSLCEFSWTDKFCGYELNKLMDRYKTLEKHFYKLNDRVSDVEQCEMECAEMLLERIKCTIDILYGLYIQYVYPYEDLGNAIPGSLHEQSERKSIANDMVNSKVEVLQNDIDRIYEEMKEFCNTWDYDYEKEFLNDF